MANLAETRKNLAIAAIVLTAASLFALLYLVAPLSPATAEHYKELDQTRSELKNAERQVLPLRGLPAKLEKSQHDIRTFYRERLPSRYSLISEELGRVAARNGVSLSEVQYDTLETDLPELELVTMNAAVSGDYAKVMRFINGVERNKIFFLIDGLTLDDQKAGVVRLDLRLEAYLRLAPEPNLGPPTQKINKQSGTGD